MHSKVQTRRRCQVTSKDLAWLSHRWCMRAATPVRRACRCALKRDGNVAERGARAELAQGRLGVAHAAVSAAGAPGADQHAGACMICSVHVLCSCVLFACGCPSLPHIGGLDGALPAAKTRVSRPNCNGVYCTEPHGSGAGVGAQRAVRGCRHAAGGPADGTAGEWCTGQSVRTGHVAAALPRMTFVCILLAKLSLLVSAVCIRPGHPRQARH